MKNKYHENDIINQQFTDLFRLAKMDRSRMTKDELENLRMDMSFLRLQMVGDTFLTITQERAAAELLEQSVEGPDFKKMFIGYTNEVNPSTGKKYTASVAESIARKAVRAEGTRWYDAKQRYDKAKAVESMMYQLFKSVDNACHSLSVISKVN